MKLGLVLLGQPNENKAVLLGTQSGACEGLCAVRDTVGGLGSCIFHSDPNYVT